VELTHRQQDGVDIFGLHGRVDGSSDFQNRLAAAIDNGARKLVLDLSGLLYINSSGLGVFALAHKQLQPVGGEMVLAGASQHIRHILQIVGFEKLFRTFPSVAEAAAALNQQ